MYKLQKKELIGEGCCSMCYLLDDKTVYKEFKIPIYKSEIKIFSKLFEYRNESICLPIEFISKDKRICGYVMPRIMGETIGSCFNESNIVNMSTNSILLEKNIDYMSKGNILMDDFHAGNLMYDNEKFTIIDIDSYFVPTSYSTDEVIEKNREFHRIMISNLFINNLLNDKYKRLIVDKILPIKYSKIKTNELIIEIKMILDKFYKEDIKTMNQLKKIVSR